MPQVFNNPATCMAAAPVWVWLCCLSVNDNQTWFGPKMWVANNAAQSAITLVLSNPWAIHLRVQWMAKNASPPAFMLFSSG
jgi:hypothetical protein